jgi:hypothetical protein
MRSFLFASLAIFTLSGCEEDSNDTSPFRKGPHTAHVQYDEIGGNGKFFSLARRDPKTYCSPVSAAEVSESFGDHWTAGKVAVGKATSATYVREGQIIWRRIEVKGRGLNRDILQDSRFIPSA